MFTNSSFRPVAIKKILVRFVTLLAFALTAALPAQADETPEIIIYPGGEGAFEIAVVPFQWNSQLMASETALDEIVSADLARSGQFKPLEETSIIERPYRMEDVRFGTWDTLGAEYLVIGQVKDSATEGLDIEMQLVNVKTRDRMLYLNFPSQLSGMRYTAHHIADTVYEAIMGQPGAFRTRIAYVTTAGPLASKTYSLMVADADGFNPQPVVRSREPLLSPAWSPDARWLAYVSFEEAKPVIFTQELSTGSRQRIADFKGINSAPAWSPDGTRLAMALSRGGNLEIYIMDMATRNLSRVTNHWSIDTEPAWTPDGQTIIFTSDRSGKPQLYEIPVAGGEAKRITFEGDENARASIAGDGNMVAMAHVVDGNYGIGLLNRATGVTTRAADNTLSESPSFAPNGSMILFASKRGENGILSAVPVISGVTPSGRAGFELVVEDGSIQEPAWSPIRQ